MEATTRARRPVLRVGIGGPVGSGKTALMDALCKYLRDRFELAAVTNDIYTREDAEFLVRSTALPPDRIVGVETPTRMPRPHYGAPTVTPREFLGASVLVVRAVPTRLRPRRARRYRSPCGHRAQSSAPAR